MDMLDIVSTDISVLIDTTLPTNLMLADMECYVVKNKQSESLCVDRYLTDDAVCENLH